MAKSKKGFEVLGMVLMPKCGGNIMQKMNLLDALSTSLPIFNKLYGKFVCKDYKVFSMYIGEEIESFPTSALFAIWEVEETPKYILAHSKYDPDHKTSLYKVSNGRYFKDNGLWGFSIGYNPDGTMYSISDVEGVNLLKVTACTKAQFKKYE